jgi:hypothetical protein
MGDGRTESFRVMREKSYLREMLNKIEDSEAKAKFTYECLDRAVRQNVSSWEFPTVTRVIDEVATEWEKDGKL